MKSNALTCPHCGRIIEPKKEGKELTIFLSDDEDREFMQLAAYHNCGSPHQFANRIFYDAMSKLLFRQRIEEAKADADLNKPAEDVMLKDIPIQLSDREVDVFATIAEKNGYDTIAEFARDRLLESVLPEWAGYELDLAKGVLSIMAED